MALELNSISKLYIDLLKDLYDAENQLVDALPKMVRGAQSNQLKEGFEKHLRETKGQVRRLEEIFSRVDFSPNGKKCVGMEGLVKEGDEILKEELPSPIRDAALITAAQKVEHYEMAGYGTARTFAEILGEREAARLLQETLNEEKMTDEHLTRLAESHINKEAMRM